MNIPAERIRQQIVLILEAWGMEPDFVRTTADVMVDTDLAGIDSHGISMLISYEKMWSQGQLNLKPRPRVVRENAVTALVDGDAGLGHVPGILGMELAIKKARASSAGVVSVFNSGHFGAAGYYAAMAAKQGLVGLVTSTARAVSVLATHSAVPVLSTNPIAFAAPAKRNPPFLLDMSTSTVPMNKVKVYDFHRKPIPAGWVLDENGKPVTDSALAMDYIYNCDVGGLTPLGGSAEMSNHKGYGLGVMAQILSATLAGAAFPPIRNRTQQASDPDNIGHFFMALDPKAFRPDGAFEHDLDEIIDFLHATRPSDPARPVLVAGDPEYRARRERLRNGIPIPDSFAEKLRAICERAKAPFVLNS